jgi:hypothetical protein
MTNSYNTRVIQRVDAVEMKVAARLLNLIGVVDVKTFMARSATTLGRRIYIPFTTGIERDHWSLWDQITTCVHEHQHVVQYEREGQTFMWKYLLRSAARAHYEADAYRCDLELQYWRDGSLPDVHALAELLRNYKCNETDIAVTEKQFNLSIKTLEQGAIINEASRRAIRWLDAYPMI